MAAAPAPKPEKPEPSPAEQWTLFADRLRGIVFRSYRVLRLGGEPPSREERERDEGRFARELSTAAEDLIQDIRAFMHAQIEATKKGPAK